MCNCGKNRIVAPAGGRSVPVATGGARVSVAPAPAASRQVVSAPPAAASVSTRTVRRLPRTVVKSGAAPAAVVGTKTIPTDLAQVMRMATVPSAPPPAPVVTVARATQVATPVSKPPVPQKAIVAVRTLPPRRHKQILPPTRNKHGASRPAAPAAVTVAHMVDDGIVDPAIWGPSLWKVLHTLAVKAAGDASWPAVLDALRSALPCPECSYHYNAWGKRFPVTRSIDIGEWLRNLHNDVNRRTRRQPWTAAMISDTYSKVTSLDAAMAMLNGKLGESAYKLLAAMVARVMSVVAAPTLEVTELPEVPAVVAPAVVEVSVPAVEETNTDVSVPVTVEEVAVVEETNTDVSAPVEAPAVVAEIPEVSAPVVEVVAPAVEEVAPVVEETNTDVSAPVTVEEVAAVEETNTDVSVAVVEEVAPVVEEVAVPAEEVAPVVEETNTDVSVAAAMD